MARGEVIGLLNADDFLAGEDVLSRVMGAFSNAGTDGVYGDLLYVKRRRGRLAQHRYWRSGAYSPEAFLKGWMPPHPTLYLRKETYAKAGNFRTDFGSAADYEFMVRLTRLGDLTLAYVPEILVCMEVGGMSNRSLTHRRKAHRMDCKAWRENGLFPEISQSVAKTAPKTAAVLAEIQELRLPRLGQRGDLNRGPALSEPFSGENGQQPGQPNEGCFSLPIAIPDELWNLRNRAPACAVSPRTPRH